MAVVGVAVTPEEVRRRADAVAYLHDDPESAHQTEDALHVDVLYAIAGGAPNAAELAAAALRTRSLTFPRWYA